MDGFPNLLPPPTQINDTHKHYDVAAAIIVMLVLGTFVTLARLFCQWRYQTFGWDDWAIIPALLLFIGHSIMGIYCNLNGGIGKPLWEVSYGEFQIWFKGVVGTTFIYPAMTAAVRVSILLFYSRIFAQTHVFTRWAVRVTLLLNAIYVIIYSIIPGFVCTPISYGWRLLDNKPAHCKSNDFFYKYSVSLYGISVGFDVLVLLIPIYPVMQLQMSMRKKVGALVMFALGTSSCIAASYKLAIFVQQWGRYGHIDPRWLSNILSLLVPPQFDHYGYTFWIPSQVEPTAAMIGASLPALRRYIKKPVGQITTALSSLSSNRKSKTPTAGKNSGMASSTALSSGRNDKDHPFVKIEPDSSSASALRLDYELDEMDRRV